MSDCPCPPDVPDSCPPPGTPVTTKTSCNWRFFGMTETSLEALYLALQKGSQELKGGNVISWQADGKNESIKIPVDLTGDQYMFMVFTELQKMDSCKYGESKDRTKFLRTQGISSEHVLIVGTNPLT
jgi:hypothetical protein